MSEPSRFGRLGQRVFGGLIRQILLGASVVLLLLAFRLWRGGEILTGELAIVGVVMVAGIAIFFGLRLVRQINALHRVVEAMVRGDFGKRAEVVGFGEAPELARRFNHMLDHVSIERRSLVNAERRWMQAMEGSGLGVWDWNVKNDKVFFSPQWKAMLGYSADEIGDSVREWSDRIHPDDLDACYANLGRHTQGDTASFSFEYRMRAKNKTWRWVLGQGIVLERAPDNSALRIAGTHIDVTERHQMEEALRESEQHLRRVLDSLFSFVGVMTPDGILTEINEAPLKVSGLTRPDILGKHLADTWWATHSPATQARVRDGITRAANGELVRYDEFMRVGDERLIEIDFAIIPMRDSEGLVTHLVPSAVDITARKAAERELSRHRDHLEDLVTERTFELGSSEARTLAILSTLQDAVIQIDAEGLILIANRAAAEIFGYSEAELPGMDIAELMPDKHRNPHKHGLAHYRAGGESKVVGNRLELEGLRRDGSVFALELAVSELSHGSSVTFIGVLRDITEQRAVELARESALAEARRLAKVKSEFLANMSHEIRTPLNGVLGLAQIGARESAGRKMQETFDRILDSGQHLLAVINDILDFSKIEAGKLKVESASFELANVVDSAVSFVSARAESKGLPLKVEFDAGLPLWVEGDALRLNQILINLLSNAVKFTEHGEIDLRVHQNAETIDFDVRDTGIGMTPPQRERLFQAFEQADGSTTRLYGGTGLGLAISQNLAQLMGGRIEVTSTEGAGSVFTLRLPLAAAAAVGESKAEPLANGASLKGLRLLAAEDVEANRLVLEDMLSEEGATVVFAVNGREAIELLDRDIRFDLVLMDIQMPVMDGYEAATRIRAHFPALPVIGLTAHAMAEERQRCLAVGMVEHVTKPIDLEKLLAAILRHVKPTPVSAVDNAMLAPLALTLPMPTDIIDWPALMKRYRNRAAFIHTLAASVVTSESASPMQLRVAAARGDHAEVAKLAHNMKSVSGNLEAWALNKQAIATEHAARAVDPETAAHAQQLAEMIDAFLGELGERESRLPLPAKVDS